MGMISITEDSSSNRAPVRLEITFIQLLCCMRIVSKKIIHQCFKVVYLSLIRLRIFELQCKSGASLRSSGYMTRLPLYIAITSYFSQSCQWIGYNNSFTVATLHRDHFLFFSILSVNRLQQFIHCSHFTSRSLLIFLNLVSESVTTIHSL